jgi:transcription-repair coupling factor (superfamily II helicase)
LSTTALKRLYALEEFSDLGTGFQLAMRDLELRGAGTILGGEQSGFIDALGFELYNQLLEEAVRELKSTEFKEIFKNETVEPTLLRRDVQVQIASDALIPAFYVPDDTERFDLYKRLYQATSGSALQHIREELVDRFGTLPATTEALFRAVRLKNVAGAIGFDKVVEHKHDLVFELSANDPQTDLFYLRHFEALMRYITEHPTDVRLATTGTTLKLTLVLGSTDPLERAEDLRASILAWANNSDTAATKSDSTGKNVGGTEGE